MYGKLHVRVVQLKELINVYRTFMKIWWFRVNEIKVELGQQIRGDFEEAFQGSASKVK